MSIPTFHGHVRHVHTHMCLHVHAHALGVRAGVRARARVYRIAPPQRISIKGVPVCVGWYLRYLKG